MDHHASKIYDLPAVTGQAFLFAFTAMLLAYLLDDAICKRVEHTVAGACTDDEIIGKSHHVFEFQQNDILAFFVFQGVDDFAGKFKCVQGSPHDVNGEERGTKNRRVYTDPVG